MIKKRLIRAIVAALNLVDPRLRAVVAFCKKLVYETKARRSGYRKHAESGDHWYIVEVDQRLRWYSPFTWAYLAILFCACIFIGPIIGVIYSFEAVYRGLKKQHRDPLVIRYTLTASEQEIGLRLLQKYAQGDGDIQRFAISYGGTPGADLLKQAAEEDAVQRVVNHENIHTPCGLGDDF